MTGATAGLQIMRMDVFLGRIIVPPAGIIKIVPRANQMVAMAARGGTAQPAREERMILPQPRIEIRQKFV